MAEEPEPRTAGRAAHDPFAGNDLSREPPTAGAWHPACCEPAPMSSPITPDIAAREAATRAGARLATTTLLLLVFLAAPAAAQDTPDASPMSQNAAASQVTPVTVTCSSKIGETTHCAADTSKGVVLARSYGTAACLLGKTWGYDDRSVWVSDGCVADFLVAGTAAAGPPPETTKKAPRYIPNGGFLIVEDELGEVYVRLFSYARYLNQLGLDETYTDAFGNVHTVQRRQDAQLQKFFLPFSGWFLTPKFRYYLYVWSANTSQGDAAQVVGAGNISYVFNKYVTFGGGITSLPSVRSTEGQFPYWLGVDDRLIADEFFRGSYTTGFWLKGEFATKFKYMAMIANNLSTLGVSAAQMDNTFDTQSYMLQWLPTTGEFGLCGNVWRLRLSREARDTPGDSLHVEHRRQTEPARHGWHREQLRSASPMAARSSRRTCSARASRSTG